MGKTVRLGSTILTMFNVGGGEIFMILLLALLLLGPEKLPEAARKVGKFLAEVRRVTSGFEEEVRSALDIGQSHTVDDALDRTTEGPRLVAPVDPVAPTPAAGPPTPFVGDLSANTSDNDDTTST
jgi:Tat protein translocase TatB subunit